MQATHPSDRRDLGRSRQQVAQRSLTDCPIRSGRERGSLSCVAALAADQRADTDTERFRPCRHHLLAVKRCARLRDKPSRHGLGPKRRRTSAPDTGRGLHRRPGPFYPGCIDSAQGVCRRILISVVVTHDGPCRARRMPVLFSHRKNVAISPLIACAHLNGLGAAVCRFGACGHAGSRRTLQRGERLSGNEQTCLRVHVIRRGLVAACAMMPDGRRQILCLYTPGDPVCPMSVEGSDWRCEALTETEVCDLDLSGETKSWHGDPSFNLALFRLVHEQLERSATHVVTLGRFDGMERVCGFLAEMTHRIGQPHGAAWRVCLPMSREDIADFLALNADTVSRLLTRIKKAGLVRFRSRIEYEIPSLDRLEARVPVSFGRSLQRTGHARSGLAS